MQFRVIPLVLFLLSANAFALRDNNKTVNKLGVSTSGGEANSAYSAYFGVEGGLSTACKFGIIYFDITTSEGQAAYANILTAKTSGMQLSRIDYIQESNEFCRLTLVEVQQ